MVLIIFFIFFIILTIIVIFIGGIIPADDRITFGEPPLDKMNIIDILENEDKNDALNVQYPNQIYNKLSTREECLIYICGFNSNVNEGQELIQHLSSKHDLLAIIPRLPGQSVYNIENSYDNINVYHYLRRIYNIAYGCHKLGKKIILVSYSTGSTYAIWLTHRFGKTFNILSSIMISPNIEPYGMGSFFTKLCLLPFGIFFTHILNYRIKIQNTTISSKILYNLVGILEIVRKIRYIPNNTSIYIFLNKKDTIVNTKATEKFLQRYTGPKRVEYLNLDSNIHNMVENTSTVNLIKIAIDNYLLEYLNEKKKKLMIMIPNL